MKYKTEFVPNTTGRVGLKEELLERTQHTSPPGTKGNFGLSW
jgi:hypothetical protein